MPPAEAPTPTTRRPDVESLEGEEEIAIATIVTNGKRHTIMLLVRVRECYLCVIILILCVERATEC